MLHWNGAEWSSEQIQTPAQQNPGACACSASVRPYRARTRGCSPSCERRNNEIGALPPRGRRRRLRMAGRRTARLAGAQRAACRRGEEALRRGQRGSAADDHNRPSDGDQGRHLDRRRASQTRNATTVFFEARTAPGARRSELVRSRAKAKRRAPRRCSNRSRPGSTAASRGPRGRRRTPTASRVITGLTEGASLRLAGHDFVPVLALGSSQRPNDVGGSRGAAFASADEGWLGNRLLPVHITETPGTRPDPALSGAVPQGADRGRAGTRRGSRCSGLAGRRRRRRRRGRALRTGRRLEAGKPLRRRTARSAAPDLRAVAWPTCEPRIRRRRTRPDVDVARRNRLLGTGPREPPNFDGNLLGIAFDPNNPCRGYAVGQQGVLLSYGKGWKQVPACAEPARQNRRTAFRRPPPARASRRSRSPAAKRSSRSASSTRRRTANAPYYTGGLLENSGSGWRIDAGAEQALGTGSRTPSAHCPTAAPRSPQPATGSPPNRADAPRSSSAKQAAAHGRKPPRSTRVTKLRARWRCSAKTGTLRIVGAGAVPNTLANRRSARTARRLPRSAGRTVSAVRRATCSARRRPAGATRSTTATRCLRRTPTTAPTTWSTAGTRQRRCCSTDAGTDGWAVGGEIDLSQRPNGDTSDIGRYPAETNAPAGVSAAPVPTSTTERDCRDRRRRSVRRAVRASRPGRRRA